MLEKIKNLKKFGRRSCRKDFQNYQSFSIKVKVLSVEAK
jgi:hypothetical protein